MHKKLGLFLSLAIHIINRISPIPLIHHGPIHRIQMNQIIKPFGEHGEAMAI